MSTCGGFGFRGVGVCLFLAAYFLGLIGLMFVCCFRLFGDFYLGLSIWVCVLVRGRICWAGFVSLDLGFPVRVGCF